MRTSGILVQWALSLLLKLNTLQDKTRTNLTTWWTYAYCSVLMHRIQYSIYYTSTVCCALTQYRMNAVFSDTRRASSALRPAESSASDGCVWPQPSLRCHVPALLRTNNGGTQVSHMCQASRASRVPQTAAHTNPSRAPPVVRVPLTQYTRGDPISARSGRHSTRTRVRCASIGTLAAWSDWRSAARRSARRRKTTRGARASSASTFPVLKVKWFASSLAVSASDQRNALPERWGGADRKRAGPLAGIRNARLLASSTILTDKVCLRIGLFASSLCILWSL